MSYFILQKWRTRGQNRSCLGVGTSGREEDEERVYEDAYGLNIVYTPVETIPGMGVVG
jgi:hypothetical protein